MKEIGTPCVLVAESNVIVALDVCLIQQEAGEPVTGPLVTEALSEGRRVDLAVIEPLLEDNDGSRPLRCVPRRRVPFVLHTTCHREDSIARGFGGSPCFAKPEIPWDIVITLDEFAIGSL